MSDWKALRQYEGDNLRELMLPVGGIGTGFVGIYGSGALGSWEIMNRPNRGWRPMYAHLILRTQRGNDVRLSVLERDLDAGLASDQGQGETLAALPRWKEVAVEATYPFGKWTFRDPHQHVQVTLEAYNPMVPGDVDGSSFPVAMLTLELTNPGKEPVEAHLSYVGSNIIGCDGVAFNLKDNVTELVSLSGWSGMVWSKAGQHEPHPALGTMAILFDSHHCKVARRWAFRDQPWQGERLGLFDSLAKHGFVDDDVPSGEKCPPSPQDTWDSSMSTPLRLGPGETKRVRMLIAWHFPYRDIPGSGWSWTGGQPAILKNYYTTQFDDAMDVAQKFIRQEPELRRKTVEFVNRIVARKAPEPIREAALCTSTALRTHTSFRLEDGRFFGFEGCNGQSGCCHGSCTHVWNYEEATLALFPDLHRSMIETHLEFGMTPEGGERFRTDLPLTQAPKWDLIAADGQMGLIVRIYEQYRHDKNKDWLIKHFPAVQRMIEFAWRPGSWDADQDGVMEGSQHNTYDVNFEGPNPLCSIWYLAALHAAAAMADVAGAKDFAAKCRSVAKSGADKIDRELYNGHFYQQHVPPGNTSPFQVGEGCLIDQLCGQYKAHRAGLGNLLDVEHMRTALKTIFENNYRENFRGHWHNMRTFATADEQGTLICSYPNGGRPEVPFPYWGECMTGFEYALAATLLDYGMKEEGLKVAKAVRDRHAGHNRNPFNEPECGSYYARAMAAWSLLDAWDNAGHALR
jgi:uncharacterized protein (DUF608 family)